MRSQRSANHWQISLKSYLCPRQVDLQSEPTVLQTHNHPHTPRPAAAAPARCPCFLPERILRGRRRRGREKGAGSASCGLLLTHPRSPCFLPERIPGESTSVMLSRTCAAAGVAEGRRWQSVCVGRGGGNV